MKAIIWILSLFFGYGLPVAILKMNGTVIGAVPTVIHLAVVFGFIKVFCLLYDDKVAAKKATKLTEAAEQEGKTLNEYLLKDAPSSFEGTCEHYRGKNKELKDYLKSCEESGYITKDTRIIFYNEYRK